MSQPLELKSTLLVSSPYLVFRGTEQHIKDTITNLTLDTLPSNTGKVEIHQGFKNALDAVWREIEAALTPLTCPIFYTGHSLGTALATLAAARQPPSASSTATMSPPPCYPRVLTFNISARCIHSTRLHLVMLEILG